MAHSGAENTDPSLKDIYDHLIELYKQLGELRGQVAGIRGTQRVLVALTLAVLGALAAALVKVYS